MFYSHSFLSRKGPLGAVWIAAHLQNRLRKSHVAGTNISASVDYIMFSETPIALRLSGHLLLGVVRIYSKKVDYLYEDCNEVLTQLRSAFASVQVNLPEDASHAPFHSVTLPETFELDAWDINDARHIAEAPDDHIKAYEEITMTDQIPAEGNPYVAFLIFEDSQAGPFQAKVPNGASEALNEDVTVGINDPSANNRADNSSEKSLGYQLPEDVPEIHLYQTNVPNIAEEPMDEDAFPSITPLLRRNGDESMQGLTPSNQAVEFNQRPLGEHSSQDLPEIEILRDAVTSFRSGSLVDWPDRGDNIVEQQEQFDQITNKKDNLSPITELPLVSRREYLPSQSHPLASTAGSVEVPEIFDSKLSFGVPEIAIQPSPLVKGQKATPGKRKKLIDYDTLVLGNKLMHEQLRDTSNLKRQRKSLPVRTIDVQRSYKSSQGEQIFLEPSVSGICTELQEVFKKDFLAPKDGSVPRVSQSPAIMVGLPMETEHTPNAESLTGLPLSEMETQAPHRHLRSPSTTSVCERETETPRHREDCISGSLPEFIQSPSRSQGFIPSSASNLGSVSLSGKTLETEPLQTPELQSVELSSLESHSAGSAELSAGYAAQPDIPHVLNSKEEEDLNFLETNATQAGHEGNEVETLTGRTRAVAQYLKKQIPVSQIPEDQQHPLSLSRILQRKTRKQCALMFFETMVLASYGFINVQQEVAFSDIAVTQTPMLLNVKL